MNQLIKSNLIKRALYNTKVKDIYITGFPFEGTREEIIKPFLTDLENGIKIF